MIDTVVLLLSSDMFEILNPDRFSPSARWITNNSTRTIYGMQSRQNPTKKEMLAGIYKPRLTLFYSFHEKQPVLKVELSLPKLFFGNNFQELKGKDLQPLLQKLADTLKQMEVIVDPKNLAKASISAIHYSKNITLTDGSTPYHYINKLKESNMKMSLDVNQTDYRNEGHSYKWHCNSYEIVFYDKIKDLEKAKLSDKRAIEKDSAIQLNLFPQFAERKKKLEILRMEVRLNKRQKMKQLFAKLVIKSDFTFKSLFKPNISKKVLLHYLDELESKRFPIFDHKIEDDKAFLVDLVFNNPQLSVKKIIQFYGMTKAIEIIGLQELRYIFSRCMQKNLKQFLFNTKIISNESKNIKLKEIRRLLIK